MNQVAWPLNQTAQLPEVHERQVDIDQAEAFDEVLAGIQSTEEIVSGLAADLAVLNVQGS